jgi:hypothetical protein
LAVYYFYFKLLEPFLNSNPASINAIASVIEKLNFSNWTGYLFGGGTSIAWSFERKGKKRAIKEKGKYQKMIESKDIYRSSSGLTNTGETPKTGGKK